ncbi:MAG: hypothetical protein HXY34_00250 [Candidatus Thorarchaeota archaeon]|nr:hypothetical protein [Candidatus Thorarchaeota archaeon]
MASVPLGVVVLAVLNILAGILLLVGSWSILSPWSWLFLGSFLLSIPNATLIVGLLYVLIGLGLLSLASWAWWADMVFAIINLILLLISYPSIAWLPLIVNLIIVLYLNQGGIRRRFHV